MAETAVKKHVTNEALKAALQVVKTNIGTIAQGKVDALALKTINGESIMGSGDITIDLSSYVKTVDLDGALMAAADGEALANEVFTTQVEPAKL